MIADGVLNDPKPDIAFAMHLWTPEKFGNVRVVEGPCMSSSSVFTLTVQGKGGHGAAPHLAVDPVLAAAHIVAALQSIVSRNVNPQDSVVVSIGQFSAGTRITMIFVILGMHKSGTTLVSQTLHASGINMGDFDSSLTYDTNNKFERHNTQELNRDMLHGYLIPPLDYLLRRPFRSRYDRAGYRRNKDSNCSYSLPGFTKRTLYSTSPTGYERFD